ncbi:MAG: LysM peptidoglycan-binding domain-containing protein [Planctomycetota bacterium]|jgi:LysM repeat protein|nr:LysM peptidoglycan-binding domain-containing protein [Planctomycetota bacterium]
MNKTSKNAILGFVTLFAIAVAGSYFGSSQANPEDAEPDAVLMQPSDLDSVQLLPKERRVQYIKPSDFNNGDLPQAQFAASTPNVNPQPAPLSSPMPVSDDLKIVIVREGDTLGAIAKRELGISSKYKDIMRWNNISDERSIKIGQQLQIRLNEEPQRQPASEQAANIERVHVVESGDVLGKISQKYYGTSKKVNLIMQANQLASPNNIRVGQRLIIPAE